MKERERERERESLGDSPGQKERNEKEKRNESRRRRRLERGGSRRHAHFRLAFANGTTVLYTHLYIFAFILYISLCHPSVSPLLFFLFFLLSFFLQFYFENENFQPENPHSLKTALDSLIDRRGIIKNLNFALQQTTKEVHFELQENKEKFVVPN